MNPHSVTPNAAKILAWTGFNAEDLVARALERLHELPDSERRLGASNSISTANGCLSWWGPMATDRTRGSSRKGRPVVSAPSSREPIEPVSRPNSSQRSISSVLGVFAGTGRGAVIGAVVGTAVCFLILMLYLAYDLVAGSGRQFPLGTKLATLVAGAIWCLASSLVGGGIVGAFVGAMIGTFFPVRRGSR